MPATISLIYDREGNRKYLTAAERGAFLEVARCQRPEIYTFCLTLTYTGARISEVLALTSSRIDLEANMIVLESLKKRQRGVFRAVPVPVELISMLSEMYDLGSAQQHLERARQRIWPWCRTTAWSYVKECMTKAEVKGAHATPKGLRHAFGVGALQAGVPINFVRKWLGHARLSTTEIYADAIGEEERAIVSRFWQTF